MIEIILGLIILFLLGVVVYERNENKKERSKLLNALMSRTPEQFRDLELAEKVKPIEASKKTEPDFVAESELSDEEFKKLMGREIA